MTQYFFQGLIVGLLFFRMMVTIILQDYIKEHDKVIGCVKGCTTLFVYVVFFGLLYGAGFFK